MAKFTRIGFGQVEPNQLSAQKTGQIYASLPLDKEVDILQNGEFMYYDYGNNSVNAGKEAGEDTIATVGEPMLVFNEIKIYEENLALKDFAMIRVGDNYVTNKAAVGRVTTAPIDPKTGGEADPYQGGAKTEGIVANPVHTEYQYRMDGFAPRLFKTNIGDIYTTNMVKTDVEYKQGDLLAPKKNTDTNTMVLEKVAKADGMTWMVVKVYTMPDMQPGLKLQRVQ